jgi:hypothetical protein
MHVYAVNKKKFVKDFLNLILVYFFYIARKLKPFLLGFAS